MREKQSKINYQPELAKKMKEDMELIIKFYSQNFVAVYYEMWELWCQIKGDIAGRDLFKKLSDVAAYNEFELREVFEEDRQLLKKYEIYKLISDASAFRFLAKIFDKELYALQEQALSLGDFTRGEKGMIDIFYNRLYGPLRNPNIQIPEGETKCYYDRHPYNNYFNRDMKASIEYIKEECTWIYELFDEKEIEEER